MYIHGLHIESYPQKNGVRDAAFAVILTRASQTHDHRLQFVRCDVRDDAAAGGGFL